jgi:hypothetical protein
MTEELADDDDDLRHKFIQKRTETTWFATYCVGTKENN